MAVCLIFIFLLFPTNIPLAADWSTASGSDSSDDDQAATGSAVPRTPSEMFATRVAATGSSVGLNSVTWGVVTAGALVGVLTILVAISDDDPMSPNSVNSPTTHH
jgi:hypothetical protein